MGNVGAVAPGLDRLAATRRTKVNVGRDLPTGRPTRPRRTTRHQARAGEASCLGPAGATSSQNRRTGQDPTAPLSAATAAVFAFGPVYAPGRPHGDGAGTDGATVSPTARNGGAASLVGPLASAVRLGADVASSTTSSSRTAGSTRVTVTAPGLI